MTLHWWMHWFWVTTLLTLHAAHRSAYAAPRPEQAQSVATIETEHERRADRQSRAMYFAKTSTTRPSTTVRVENITQAANETDTTQPPTTAKTSIADTDANDTDTTTPAAEATNAFKRRNLTKQKDVEEGAVESRIVTEKPLSLETTLLHPRVPQSSADEERLGVNAAAVAGAVFGAVVVVSLAGSTAFVLYRRRYLNKPQTLNDKCSNPDSSGYLDDSTIRDNSEEMYSLDNDSFLNSLEVMTFQNYWTDVKHTKL